MTNELMFISKTKDNNDIKAANRIDNARWKSNDTFIYGTNIAPKNKALKETIKISQSECQIRKPPLPVAATSLNNYKVKQSQIPIGSNLSLHGENNSVNRYNLSVTSNSPISSLTTSLTSLNVCNDTVIDTIYRIIKRIDTIEESYSIDKLYGCLKHNLKHTGYAKYTLSVLEQFNKPTLSIKEFNSNFTITQINTLNFKANNCYLLNRASYTSKLIKSITEPIRDLFRNLMKLSKLFDFIDINFISNIQIPNSHKHGNNLKYENIIGDLSEKVFILLNDKINANLNLFSNETKLSTASKYEFFKIGEYIIRLIPDVIYKLRQILKYFIKLYGMENYFDEDIDKLFKLPSINYRNPQSRLEKLPQILNEHVQKINKHQPLVINHAANKLQQSQDQIAKKLQMTSKSLNDSFIIETDSSVISDDDGNEVNDVDDDEDDDGQPSRQLHVLTEGKKHNYSIPVVNLPQQQYPQSKSQLNKNKKLPGIKEKSHKNACKSEKENLNKKVEFLNYDDLVFDFKEHVDYIVKNDKHTKLLEEKLKLIIELLKDTDVNLTNIDSSYTDSEDDRRVTIEQELNLFKYRLKIVMQNSDNYVNDGQTVSTVKASNVDTDLKYDSINFYYDLIKKQLVKLNNKIRILFEVYY